MTSDQAKFHLSTLTFYLDVKNPATSGAGDDDVYICLTGLDPASGSSCYLDFSSGAVTVASQVFSNGAAMKSISALKSLAATFPASGFQPVRVLTDEQGLEYISIYVPAMKSSRMYFSVGSAFAFTDCFSSFLATGIAVTG